MARKAKRIRRLQAVRAMFKPLRDARMKREKRAALKVTTGLKASGIMPQHNRRVEVVS